MELPHIPLLLIRTSNVLLSSTVLRTAIIEPDGTLVYQKVDVAHNYLRGWFLIDFISCLPFGYMQYLGDDSGEQSSIRLVRLLRLVKLLRLLRLKALLDRWAEYLNHLGVLTKMLKIGFLLVVMSHWLACGWYFAGNGSHMQLPFGVSPQTQACSHCPGT